MKKWEHRSAYAVSLETYGEHQAALALLFNARSHAPKAQRHLFDRLFKEQWAVECSWDPSNMDLPPEIIAGDIRIFDPLVGVEMIRIGCNIDGTENGVTLGYAHGTWKP